MLAGGPAERHDTVALRPGRICHKSKFCARLYGLPLVDERSPVRLGSVIIPARILPSCALATVCQSVFRFKKVIWRSLSGNPLKMRRECVKEQTGSVQQEQLAGSWVRQTMGIAFLSSMCIKTLVKKQGGKRLNQGKGKRPDLLAIGSLVSY
ncbi:hypothetical protein PspLS_08592 [Pyricularia sp. CBS 133598]|nr:hypothetical protein PspLS_08592 [Pyricularia sp. CBS 133598]